MHLETAIPARSTTFDQRRILIVEDDLAIRPALERMIRKINPEVTIDWTTRAEEAFALLADTRRLESRKQPYHVVLSDISRAGEKSGLDLVDDCHARRIPANFILTSGNPDFRTSFPFLPKPQRFRDVEACLGPYLRASRAETEPVTLDQQFEWFMYVMSAALMAWLLTALAAELRHLPLQPFLPDETGPSEHRQRILPAIDPGRGFARDRRGSDRTAVA
jgi:DNA-binding NtrC family response regulator